MRLETQVGVLVYFETERLLGRVVTGGLRA